MNELAKVESVEISSGAYWDISRKGLTIDGDISIEQWRQVGEQIKFYEGAVQWWIGDWWIYSETRQWGNSQEVAEQIGFDYGTCRNAGWVARRFELSRRHDKLSFGHHLEVASLDPPDADLLLAQAELGTGKKSWSARDLRNKVTEFKRFKLRAIPDLPGMGDRYVVIQADIETALNAVAPESVNLVLTDPPYGHEYVPLFGHLARGASRWLKAGGSLLVMSGQSWIPEVMNELSQGDLRYQWTLAYMTPGPQTQIFDRNVNCSWKPVFWFVKGNYEGPWIGDVAKSANYDKSFHTWGQSESGIADLLDRMSQPGQIVVDPFCGGGTIGAVAVRMGRRFIGLDNDPDAIQQTRARLHESLAA